MKNLVIISIVALLSACAPHHDLAACKGPIFPLNAGEWQPSAADLAPHPVKS